MRRLFAVATLVTVLFAAGCGGSPDSGASGAGGTSGPGGSPTPGAGSTADTAANTKTVCEAAENAVQTGLTAALTEMGKMIAAAAQNNEADAEKAVAAAKAAFEKIGTDLRAESAKATDPALKQALEETAKGFQDMAAGITTDTGPETLDEKKLDEVGATMEKLCG